MKKSRAICILGMHRSGTSAVTRCINILGAYLGEQEQLLEPQINVNPEGFWEHIEIVDIHNEILQIFGYTWGTTIPLPMDWWKDDRIKKYRNDLIRIIEKDFLDKEIWAWKDPRTCLLLPLWQDILIEIGIDVTYVIPIRNPLDIAASLNKRDLYTYEKSLSIWTLYMAEALYWTIGKDRIIFSYDELLEDPLKGNENLLRAIYKDNEKKLSEKQIVKIKNFIKPKLRHSHSNIQDLMEYKDVSNITISIYEAFIKGNQYFDSDSFNKNIKNIKSVYMFFQKNIDSYHVERKKIQENNQPWIYSSNSIKKIVSPLIEVFWGGLGEFTKEKSISKNAIIDSDYKVYNFTIPNANKEIRIDPINFPSYIEIEYIKILTIEDEVIFDSNTSSFSSITPSNDIILLNNDKVLSFFATGIDPILIINNFNYSGEITLSISMKVSTRLYDVNVMSSINTLENTYIEHYKSLEEAYKKIIQENNLIKDQLESNNFLLEEKNNLIKQHNYTIEEQINIINQLKIKIDREIEDKNIQLEGLKINLNRANSELEVRTMELNELLNSNSWKITKPLRDIKGKFKK